jgi:hypothetical protein
MAREERRAGVAMRVPLCAEGGLRGPHAGAEVGVKAEAFPSGPGKSASSARSLDTDRACPPRLAVPVHLRLRSRLDERESCRERDASRWRPSTDAISFFPSPRTPGQPP